MYARQRRWWRSAPLRKRRSERGSPAARAGGPGRRAARHATSNLPRLRRTSAETTIGKLTLQCSACAHHRASHLQGSRSEEQVSLRLPRPRPRAATASPATGSGRGGVVLGLGGTRAGRRRRSRRRCVIVAECIAELSSGGLVLGEVGAQLKQLSTTCGCTAPLKDLLRASPVVNNRSRGCDGAQQLLLLRRSNARRTVTQLKSLLFETSPIVVVWRRNHGIGDRIQLV